MVALGAEPIDRHQVRETAASVATSGEVPIVNRPAPLVAVSVEPVLGWDLQGQRLRQDWRRALPPNFEVSLVDASSNPITAAAIEADAVRAVAHAAIEASLARGEGRLRSRATRLVTTVGPAACHADPRVREVACANSHWPVANGR